MSSVNSSTTFLFTQSSILNYRLSLDLKQIKKIFDILFSCFKSFLIISYNISKYNEKTILKTLCE